MTVEAVQDAINRAIEAAERIARATLKEDGLKSEDCQLIGILNDLRQAGHNVNGLEESDLRIMPGIDLSEIESSEHCTADRVTMNEDDLQDAMAFAEDVGDLIANGLSPLLEQAQKASGKHLDADSENDGCITIIGGRRVVWCMNGQTEHDISELDHASRENIMEALNNGLAQGDIFMTVGADTSTPIRLNGWWSIMV